MSPLGQKQTFAPRNAMSAIPPKVDIGQYDRDVRLVPNADIMLICSLGESHRHGAFDLRA
jgi:hypothetical protein